MTLPTFLLILTGVLLNAGAQLLLKAGVSPLGVLSVDWHNLVPTTLRVLSQWPILAGLGCYVVSVSIAYPMLSLGYVVNALAAWWLFGEVLGPTRWAGMMLILGGVFLMSRS
jgi:drug/metabolite transporter (DMT)-like permease